MRFDNQQSTQPSARSIAPEYHRIWRRRDSVSCGACSRRPLAYEVRSQKRATGGHHLSRQVLLAPRRRSQWQFYRVTWRGNGPASEASNRARIHMRSVRPSVRRCRHDRPLRDADVARTGGTAAGACAVFASQSPSIAQKPSSSENVRHPHVTFPTKTSKLLTRRRRPSTSGKADGRTQRRKWRSGVAAAAKMATS
jgi:hypothetical protein